MRRAHPAAAGSVAAADLPLSLPAPPAGSGVGADASAAWLEGWERLLATLGADLQPDPLYRAVCRDVALGFGFSRVLLSTVDPAARRLVARAGWDPDIGAPVYAALQRLYRIPLDPDAAGRLAAAAWCALRAEQVHVPDARRYAFRPDETYQSSLVVKALGTEEYCLTPIAHRGRVVGVLGVDKKGRGEPIRPAELRLLRAIAALLGLRLGQRLEAEPPPAAALALERAGFLESLLDALHAGVLVVGRDGRVRYANRAASELIGTPPGQIVGRRLEEALPLRERAAFRRRLASGELAAAGSHRFHISRAGLADLEVEIRTLPLRSAGLSGASAVLVEDVSKAIELERLRDDFVSMLVHDLRAPIQSVVGFAELLRSGRVGALDEEQAAFVDRIEECGSRMLGLIGRILEVAELEGGRVSPELRPVELRTLIDDVLAGLAGVAIPAGVALGNEVEPGFPAVIGDRLRLSELFQNLVDNAITASPPGGRVAVRARPEEAGGAPFARVEVVDEGEGLDDTAAERMFDKFWSRGGGARGDGRGHGLGLVIARLIVETHGGSIVARGEPGRGTTVSLLLPLHPPDEAPSLARGNGRRETRAPVGVAGGGDRRGAARVSRAGEGAS